VLVHGDRADVETLREDVAHVLAPMGLWLSQAKTRIESMSDGLNCLGLRIQWRRKFGTTKWHVYTFIADRPIPVVEGEGSCPNRQGVAAESRRSADPNQPDHARMANPWGTGAGWSGAPSRPSS
jgi:hypothetical protein